MAVFAEKGETYTIFSGVGPRGNYCWPSVAVLPGGDLIAVCSGRRFAHLCPFGRLSAAYSNDGGKTWSKPAGLLDTYTDERDAGVLAAPDGVYVTTFNNTLAAQRKFSEIMQWDGRSQRYIDAQLEMYGEYFQKNAGSLLLFGKDGYTFGTPVKIPLTAPHGPVLLNDGSVAMAGRAYPYYEEGDPLYLPDGIYWMTFNKTSFSNPVLVAPQGALGLRLYEPHAVQLVSGRILIAIRAEKDTSGSTVNTFTILTCYSDDGGKSFSPLRMTGIEGSPPHLCRLPSGDALMTYGRRKAPFGIRAALTGDGERWSEEIVLRDDGVDFDLGYPATCILRSGDLYTVYYMKNSVSAKSAVYGTKWRL